MTPESPQNLRAELEARMTAMLLGELSEDDSALLSKLIEHDAELRQIHDQLKRTIDRVRESAVEMPDHTPTPLKLSEDRRQKVLAQFKTVRPREFAQPRRRASRLVPLVAAAAMIMLLGSLLLPALSKAKSKSQRTTILSNLRQLDAAKQQWAIENNKSLEDTPTMNNLRPYLGRGDGLGVVADEEYEIGKVAEAPKAEIREGNRSRVLTIDGLAEGRSAGVASAPPEPAAAVAGEPARGRFDRRMPAQSSAAQDESEVRRSDIVLPAQVPENLSGVDRSGDYLAMGTGLNSYYSSFDVLAPAIRSERESASAGGQEGASTQSLNYRFGAQLQSEDGEQNGRGWFEREAVASVRAESRFHDLSVAAAAGFESQGLEARDFDVKTDVSTGGSNGIFSGNPVAQNGPVPPLSDASGSISTQTPRFAGSAAFSLDEHNNVVVAGDELSLREISQTVQNMDQRQRDRESLRRGGTVELASKLTVTQPGGAGESSTAANGPDTRQPATVAPAALPASSVMSIPRLGRALSEERQEASAGEVMFKKVNSVVPAPQPEVQTRNNAFSTFSLNVSDVSFKLAAASLERGVMPDAASIRSEEFINAFDYRDPEPAPGAPIAFAWERARYPFAHNRDLLRLSLKTAAAGREPGKALNVVLLLDRSGSMERADRVQIVRAALRVLAKQLQPQDRLSVVTFARTPRLWADGIQGAQAVEAVERLIGLAAEGGTNIEEAMNLAYATALRHYLAAGINRVVLLTDGAANLGNVEPESLKEIVETHRRQGVALDCFGIGWEGYNDDLLETLSRNGDGRYGFINSPDEAAEGFAAQLAGALKVAASDVKVQVEFNPNRVISYRQFGYAKHQLTKEQFRDNTVDAAEIAAAESGNALYTAEVNPAGEGPIATVRVRFKVPGTSDYREHAWTVPDSGNAVVLDQASPSMRLAATAGAFAEWLESSPFAADVTPDKLLGYLDGVPEVCGADERPKRLEWMIRQAKAQGL